ncbi:MAG: peptidase S8/S53 subtilisin kexin sedolisin, partial [Chloroflexi bacterium OLB15]
MARKHILGLFVLGLFLLAIFAVIAVAIRPAPQEVVAMPTLMSLPTVTETNTPTDIPTLPPNTDTPTEAPAAPTSTIEEAAPISAETSRPTESLAPTVPTNTATATATSVPTEIPPTAEIAPTVPPVVIINSSAPEVVQPPAPAVENVVVIAFESDSSAEERAAYIESINGEVESSIEALNTVVVSVPDTVTAQALSAAPIVAQTEPDYFATVLTAPDDPLYSQQWALQAIGAESAWGELPADAQQITVAVIDTGICADHAELQGRILAGYDFVDDDAVPQDEYGHGCAVAGIIAAQANNAQGIAGLAPNAQILPLRVLNGAGYGSYSDIAEAIIYAVDQGAQVINLSLGGVNPSSLLEDAVSYAMAHGRQVVAAAGNNFGGAVMYPAAYAPVISVGSVDQNLQHSSFNPAGVLDVYAPGRDISSLAINGAYTSLTGTSLAAPHVSAAIAISMALGEPFVATGQVLSLGEGGLTPTLPPTSTPEATPEGETLPETEPIIFDRDAAERPTYPVTSDLYQLAQAYEQSAAQAQAFADTTLLQVNGEQVLVEITVSDEGAIPSVVNALGSIGAQVTASGSGVIVAYIPFGQIEAAATLPGVRYIQSALPP